MSSLREMRASSFREAVDAAKAVGHISIFKLVDSGGCGVFDIALKIDVISWQRVMPRSGVPSVVKH
jgi:hypothetical protein